MSRRPRRHRRPGRLSPALAERRILLASAVGSSPEQSAALARQARAETSDGLAATFGRLAREQPDADDAQGRLLLLLVDLEHRPVEGAARLIGVPEDEARPLLTEARRQIGTERLGAPCRGWGLVCRKAQLTHPETDAMTAHVELCRRCRDRLEDLEQTRKALLARTAGVAAALATAELVTLGGGSAVVGGAGVLAGKAAIGVVGALGAAVVAGGGIAAVAQSSAADPAPEPRPSAVVSDVETEPTAQVSARPSVAPSPQPVDGAPGATGDGTASEPSPTGAPAGVSVPLPQLPVPLPVPLPSSLDLPGIPLPAPSLPQVLPTSLPLPLPTLVVSPAPLPTLPDLTLLD